MCGFAGYALHDPRTAPTEALLRRMSDTLVHRGPDDGREVVLGQAGLAFRRLSIIDLSGGWQPLFNEERDVASVTNGEIYNFQELKVELGERGHRFRTGSDCETLPHLYEEQGADFASKLIGMYAFALVDARQGRTRLVLGRDRLGIKPLYYAETEVGIFFASEPKAILASGQLGRELRPTALLDFLVQGYVGGEEAAWAGMKRVPPGCVLDWEPGGRARVRRYWDLPTGELRDPATSEEILETLDQVVEQRMVADVPLGAFLSGGVDSTAVVTSMARLSDDPPIACSVGFQERSHDELEIARESAARLNARHHTEVLAPDPTLALETLPWFFDEPLADPSTVPTYLVSKMAREHVTVALSGDGGDETFAGYRRYVHDLAENRLRTRVGAVGRGVCRSLGRVYPKFDWAPRWMRGRTFLTNVGDDPAAAYFRSVCQQDRLDVLRLLDADLAHSLGQHDPLERFREHYERPEVDCSLYRAQYADFHTYLPDQILTKVDRASMAVSLEVRVPILDHRMSERFANLPVSEKVRAGRGKHALREALRTRIPDSVLDGSKRGFDTPLRGWIRGPLRAPVADAIESLPGEWFERRQLRSLLAQHDAGARDHGRLLWSLLVLEQWRRRHDVRGLAS